MTDNLIITRVHFQVNMLRIIPGDDLGLLEELSVDREFIWEREARAEAEINHLYTASYQPGLLTQQQDNRSEL